MEDIIKEENVTLKTEYVALNKIKDPNAKIWKIRSSVLGPKHKAQESTPMNKGIYQIRITECGSNKLQNYSLSCNLSRRI